MGVPLTSANQMRCAVAVRGILTPAVGVGGLGEARAVPGGWPGRPHPIRVTIVAFRPGEEFGDAFVAKWGQLGVAVSCAAVVGVSGDGAAAVAGGVVEDVVDVPVERVVSEEGSAPSNAGFSTSRASQARHALTSIWLPVTVGLQRHKSGRGW